MSRRSLSKECWCIVRLLDVTRTFIKVVRNVSTELRDKSSLYVDCSLLDKRAESGKERATLSPGRPWIRDGNTTPSRQRSVREHFSKIGFSTYLLPVSASPRLVVAVCYNVVSSIYELGFPQSRVFRQIYSSPPNTHCFASQHLRI